MSIDIDVQETVLDRLVLCYADITGVTKAYKFEPPIIAQDDLPLIYNEYQPVQPAPRESDYELIIERDFDFYLIVQAMDIDEYDSSDGSSLMGTLSPWVGRVQSYFWMHPFLSTSSLGKLKDGEDSQWSMGVERPVEIWDREFGRTNDGFAGIRFTLNVAVKLIFKQRIFRT